MIYAVVVNCLLKCMQHSGTHKYLKGLNNYLKSPVCFLKLSFPQGAREHLFFVNCPDRIIIFENLALLFITVFVIFDSFSSPPFRSPRWFQWHKYGMCAKIPPSQAPSDRRTEHLGNCQNKVINRGQRIDTQYMLPLPELSGCLLDKEV